MAIQNDHFFIFLKKIRVGRYENLFIIFSENEGRVSGYTAILGLNELFY